MKCSNCGKTIPDTAKFCVFCGEKIIAQPKVEKPMVVKTKVKAEKKAASAEEIKTPAIPKKPFPAKKIGIIVAAVVLIAAITIAIVMLIGSGNTISGMGGTWSGYTDGDFQINFVLGSSCRLNQVCGTFSIPNFSLGGNVTFVRDMGNQKYEFKVSNLPGGGVSDATLEYLQILPTGNLYYFSSNANGTNTGILRKMG